MQKRSVSEDDLRRLKEDREAADRRYNEALSELDAAVQSIPSFPHPPPGPDETQITPLNSGWDLLVRPNFPAGWRGRLARFVWALVEPSLARQQVFNAALVDHINRNVTRQREVSKSVETTIALVREQIEQLVRFESRMIVFLQQITPYVDTKDYEFRALGQRVLEDLGEAHAETARIARGLVAMLGTIADDTLKRFERYETTRTSLATVQQAVHALRYELEQRSRQGGAAEASQPPASTTMPEPTTPASYALSGSRLDSHKYLTFEDAFRGDPALIRQRQETYIPIFLQRSDVLDIGCGRGEFLQLLKDKGVTAQGVDVNHAMVVHCLERGLDAREVDALAYLRGLPANALGGLMAAQVVEHLEPDYLLALLEEAFRVLRPGSPIALETINVSSWSAFFSSYVRDVTHARPLHPQTLQFFVLASGFLDAQIRFSSPLPPPERMQVSPAVTRELDPETTTGRAIWRFAETFDANVALLNRDLYGPLDYAVIAWRR